TGHLRRHPLRPDTLRRQRRLRRPARVHPRPRPRRRRRRHRRHLPRGPRQPRRGQVRRRQRPPPQPPPPRPRNPPRHPRRRPHRFEPVILSVPERAKRVEGESRDPENACPANRGLIPSLPRTITTPRKKKAPISGAICLGVLKSISAKPFHLRLAPARTPSLQEPSRPAIGTTG